MANGADIMTELVRDLDEKAREGLKDPKMAWKTHDHGAATRRRWLLQGLIRV
jgi:hypothetical protein